MKIPGNELNEMEISNPSDKQFKVMIIKMLFNSRKWKNREKIKNIKKNKSEGYNN